MRISMLFIFFNERMCSIYVLHVHKKTTMTIDNDEYEINIHGESQYKTLCITLKTGWYIYLPSLIFIWRFIVDLKHFFYNIYIRSSRKTLLVYSLYSIKKRKNFLAKTLPLMNVSTLIQFLDAACTTFIEGRSSVNYSDEYMCVALN